MSEPDTYYCTVCDVEIAANGWFGHQRSNKHLENGGTPDSYRLVVSDDDLTEMAAHVSAVAHLPEADVREILAENERLKQELAASRAETTKWQPFVERVPFETAADVEAHYGADHMRFIAEVRLATENKRRQKEGLPPLWVNTDQYEQMVAGESASAAQEMVADQTRWTSAVAKGEHTKLRTFKMVKPADASRDTCSEQPCYKHGSSWQVPVEDQINNGAGSLADPIERYKRRGHKAMTPLRCHLVDCWTPAAVSEQGDMLWRGYCSKLHHDYIEGNVSHSEPVPTLLAAR